MEKHREFEEMSRSAASLQKLAVFVIRKNVRDKTEENFAKLGLPACQLDLVTFERLAWELHAMYDRG